MKKTILFLLLSGFVTIANAQAPCVPGTITAPQAGYIIPDSAANLVHGCAGLPYEQIIYIKAPKDTTIALLGTVTVDSFVVNTNIVGLPAYITASAVPGIRPPAPSNPKTNFPRVVIPGDSLACIKLSGLVPASTPAGVNNLTINIRVYLSNVLVVGTLDTASALTSYNITIDPPGFGACNPAAVKDLSKLNIQNLSIAPNPAGSEAKIIFSTTTNEAYSFSMVNLLGETVWSQKQQIHRGENAITLPTANLPNGIYMVEINNGQRAIGQKLVIQH